MEDAAGELIPTMGTGRLEAFSDGVIAIIITIMVLELKVPAAVTWPALLGAWPLFLSYAMSFAVVAIMWVNHHHLLHTVHRLTTGVLWANIGLLFWMSLIPFATAFAGEHPGAALPMAAYGLVLTISAFMFTVLHKQIAATHAMDETMRAQHRRITRKNLVSVGLYGCSVPMAFVSPWACLAIFVLIPAAYFLPDRRMAELVGRKPR